LTQITAKWSFISLTQKSIPAKLNEPTVSDSNS